MLALRLLFIEIGTLSPKLQEEIISPEVQWNRLTLATTDSCHTMEMKFIFHISDFTFSIDLCKLHSLSSESVPYIHDNAVPLLPN